MNKTNGMTSALILSGVLLSGITLSGCKKQPDNESTTQVHADHTGEHKTEKNKALDVAEVIRPVQAINVSSQSIANQYNFNGIVKSGKESRLSFRIGGNLKNLSVKIGDYVRAGQFIARLDKTDYNVNSAQTYANLANIKANKQSVNASVKQAEAEMIRARAAYLRAEKLYETNSIPVSEFEQARAAWQASSANLEGVQLRLSSAGAQVDAAQQQLIAAKNQLTYTKLTAPFSGYITQVLVDENEQVGAGQPVVVLSNNNQKEIEVGLPATVISDVTVGDMVKVNFTTLPQQSFTGKVSEVSFSTVNSSVFPVTIKLSQSTRAIRPGMTASVVFAYGNAATNEQLLIPATAIGEDKGGKFVYKLIPDKRMAKKSNADVETGADVTDVKAQQMLYTIERQPIELGTMTANGFQVINGLQSGDLIAKAGLNVIQSGDVVTVFGAKLVNKSQAQ